MVGLKKSSRGVKTGSAMIVALAAMLLGAEAEAAHAQRGCSQGCSPHSGGPRVEYVTRGNAPRFLASRSTSFLATRQMTVLAAPHHLAPTSTVTFVPGPVCRPRPHDCRDRVSCDGHNDLRSHAVNGAASAAIENQRPDYAPRRAPVFRVIRTGRPS